MKKNIINFLVLLTIVTIIFIPFLHMHYSTDSYYIENNGYKHYLVNNSLKDGRVFMAGIGYIAHLINIPFNGYVLGLTALALITSCITVIILKNTILQYKNTDKLYIEILITIISYFTIFNFMFIENMFFVECFVMSLSILFYMLAAKTLVNKDKAYIIKTIMLVVSGVLCYQGTISMYLISLLVFSLLKNDKYKQVLKDFIIGGLILTFAIFVQMIAIKCCEEIFGIKQKRASNLKGIIENIETSIAFLPNIIIDTGNVFTRYIYLIFIIILEIFILIKAEKEKLDNKFLTNQLLILIFSILFGLAISFISTSGFWSARIRYSIGTTIGFLFIYFYCNTNLIENMKKTLNSAILTLFILYATATVINYTCIMNNSLKVNEKDKQMTIEILNNIKEYEEKNNIEVVNIALIKGIDENKAFYADLKYKGSVLSWSAIRTEWSIEGLLEKYSAKEFNLVEPTDEEIKTYFELVDQEKEYMCINNTIYISYSIY